MQTAVALGYFDGVHLGHRAVLRAAVEAAHKQNLTPAAFTFTLPHGGAGKGRVILAPQDKLHRIRSEGVRQILCPPFEQFSSLSPLQFVQEILVGRLNAKEVFCGGNFTFGAHKAGDVPMLKALCSTAGVGTHIVPTCKYGGKPVSSTRIRSALEQGDIPLAQALLGHPYEVAFSVARGRGLGHTLGFPTINQTYPEGMLVPRLGVYITRVWLDGMWRPSATGLGTRPTVDNSGAVTCETFIPEYNGDIYGRQVPVQFVRYLWPTQKYDSLEALTDMVHRAAALALAEPAPDAAWQAGTDGLESWNNVPPEAGRRGGMDDEG